jgi:hypothetical protein
MIVDVYLLISLAFPSYHYKIKKTFPYTGCPS